MIGDLVKVVHIKDCSKHLLGQMGIVIDALDMSSGYTMYEVLIDGTPEWIDDVHLEKLTEPDEKRWKLETL